MYCSNLQFPCAGGAQNGLAIWNLAYAIDYRGLFRRILSQRAVIRGALIESLPIAVNRAAESPHYLSHGFGMRRQPIGIAKIPGERMSFDLDSVAAARCEQLLSGFILRPSVRGFIGTPEKKAVT